MTAKAYKFPTLHNQLLKDRLHTFSTRFEDESLTQQSDLKDSDINVIMKRAATTGLIPATKREALYGDFTDIGDFRTAQDRITAAREAFNELPAALRKRFGNDPSAFIDFAQNPDNADELVKMGLAEPKEKTDNTPTPPLPAEETEYDDYGNRTRNRNADDRAGHGEDRSDRRADPQSRARQDALREREGLRPPGTREPR